MAEIFLSAHWENLIMANYEIHPDLLAPYLPKGVELDLFNNKAYVSLVGFMFKKTSLFNIPIPLLGTFEEINLRFYVKRMEGDTIKRGVVFINETVPYKLVAWLANKLYKEHYTVVPTRNKTVHTNMFKNIQYGWKKSNQWNSIEVTVSNTSEAMAVESLEEFIFEHYYGYTKVNSQHTQEYRVNHPRWNINKVMEYSIQCNFKEMYGEAFSILSDTAPASVIMAEGSPVSVQWKRNNL